MLHQSKQQVALQFLVYTRAANFDYQWVLGLEDKSVENALQDYLQDWLSTKHLAKLPPVTTFFNFQQYGMLMLAEGSETRNDLQGRQIYQRAIFMWEEFAGLRYKHLEPLAVRLNEEAVNVYDKLPDNVFSYQTRTQKYAVSLQELEEEAETINIAKCSWGLPLGLTWAEVRNYKLTVEVPKAWSFDKMIAGLADQPVSQSDAIYIGSSLRFENRVPPDHGWIVSASAEDGSEEEVRVLRSDGQTLTSAASVREQQESTAGFKARQVGSGAKGATKSAQASLKGAESSNAVSRVKVSVPATTDEKLGESDEYSQEALKNLFDIYAGLKDMPSKSEKWEFLRSIKRLLERNHLPLVQAETRLLRLLAPATQMLGNDVTVAWHYLLSEVLLSYQSPSEGMLDEWISRVYGLEKISKKSVPERQEAWRSEFSKACDGFREILRGLK